MAFETKTGQLLRYKRQAFAGDVFMYTAEDPASLSQLYALSILGGNLDGKFSKKVFQAITRTFFDSFPLNAPSNLMEDRLAAVNHELSSAGFDPSLDKNLQSYGIALAQIQEGTLSVASCGTAQISIFRNGEMLPVSETNNESYANLPDKIFPHFVSGRIIPGDTVVVSTKNLFNYLSVGHLSKILEDNAGQEACDIILKVVKEVSTRFEPVVAWVISAEHPAKARLPKKKKYFTMMPLTDFKLFNTNFLRLPKFRFYAFLTLAFLLSGLSAYYITATSTSEKSQANLENYSAKLDDIEKELNTGEAAAIYRDRNQVKEVLDKLTSQFNSNANLANTQSSENVRFLNLKKRYQELSEKLKQMPRR